MTCPRGALGDTRTRILLAVIRQRRPTVRSVAVEAGRTIANTHRHLLALQDDGFVDWQPGHQGTLVAIVEPVAVA